MEKEIILDPKQGNFYGAMAFHWCLVILLIVPISVLLLAAVINPFWFRDWFFNVIERMVQKISNWRNYKKYAIYLGCDPKVWHALRGDLK
jgi:hypothetical protein